MRLSILMPALAGRDYEPLACELQRQINRSGQTAEVLVELDRGERTSGQKRQALVNRSQGDYLAFMDDDDWISPDYVRSLCMGAAKGVDVVTFEMAIESLKRCTDRWKLGLHPDDLTRGSMAANHLCAWRRDLATKVGWCPDLGYADDQLWYEPLHACGLVRTEMHVPEPLYEYRYSPTVTMNQKPERVRRTHAYVGRTGLPCYWHGDEIVIEVGGGANKAKDPQVRTFRSDGSLATIPRNELRQFHSARAK